MLTSPTTIIRDGEGNPIYNVVEFAIKLQKDDNTMYINYKSYKTDEKGIIKIQQGDKVYNIIQDWESTLLACKTNAAGCLEIMIASPRWVGEQRVVIEK